MHCVLPCIHSPTFAHFKTLCSKVGQVMYALSHQAVRASELAVTDSLPTNGGTRHFEIKKLTKSEDAGFHSATKHRRRQTDEWTTGRWPQRFWSEQKVRDGGQKLRQLRLHVGHLSDGVATEIKALQLGAGSQRLKICQRGDLWVWVNEK